MNNRPKPTPTVPTGIPADNSGEMVASRPLTEAEIRLISVNFHRTKPLRINDQPSIRGEMIRIYDMVTKGELPLSAGMKLVYILDKISKSRFEEDKLEILKRGGLTGAPFVGLTIVGPEG